MNAAVLHRTGEALVIETDIEIPALRRGQVLVRVHFSGVCHSQLMEVEGLRGEDRFLPHMLGHEGSGEVVDVGEGVTKVKKGDQIVMGWIKGEGLDGGGAQYKQNGRVINAGGVTTFSDYAVISENRCVPLPAGVPMNIAVLFGCAVPTGAGIALNQARPEPGSSVAVIGLGGIGLSALMGVALHDCAKIIAIDVSEEKLGLARELGATHAINAATEAPLESVMKLTDGKGLDICIEAAGTTATIEMAFDMIRRGGGRCVFASHPAHGQKIAIDPFELICGKHIEGSWGGGCAPDRDVPIFAGHYHSGKLPLERLLSKTYSLNEVNQALDDLKNKRIARALLKISG